MWLLLTVTSISTVSGVRKTVTDSTDTGVMLTLRGNKKKRIRQQTRRHNTMEMHTYSFLKHNAQMQHCWYQVRPVQQQKCTHILMCSLRASGFQPDIVTRYYSNELVLLTCRW